MQLFILLPFRFFCSSAGVVSNCYERGKLTKKLAAAFRKASVVRKMLLVMKLTAIILLTALLQVSARGYSQKITLSIKNTPLEKVFQEIKKQSGYYFWYADDMLRQVGNVDVEIKDAAIEEVLEVCLKGQPLGYEIVEKLVVIKRKGEASKKNSSTVIPLIDTTIVKGKVLNEKDEPVAGVTVTVKGSRKGAFTNEAGEFSIVNVDPNAKLIISSVGYETQEVSVKGEENIKVKLREKIGVLDETVVIAYGTTTRRFNTGNVNTVKAKDIEKQPVNNPLLALQASVPGLFITQSTGMPGSGVTVRIQGQNSIRSGNDPLYVIDGVPFTSQLLANSGAVLGRSGGVGDNVGNGNPLSYINVADIESIDVLKDADATAIYGSRAANGAILITTKKGKAGQTKVDINIQSGWGKVTRKLNLLNTQQYLQMRHEALRNDGLMPNPTVDYDLTAWDTTRYTNWQKALIGGTAKYTDAQASVSGGNANTQFLVSAGYHRETTVLPGNLADQKGSLHFSIKNISTNQKFQLQLTGNYLVDNNRLISTDLTQTAIQLAPNAPALYNADGSLNWAPLSSGNSTWQNPLSFLSAIYKNKTNNLIGNALISYQILPGLNIKSSFGYTNLQSDETTLAPLLFYAPEQRPFSNRRTAFTDNNITSWITEPQASYETTIGQGKIEALIGTSIQQNNSNGSRLSARGFISDNVMEDISFAANIRAPAPAIATIYKYNAIFGRINYNWQDKYIINLTARRDGSSRFGPKNRFHNFGSIGGGWIFSNESFVKENLPFFSFGKIRGSYGTTGNDQIGDYQYLNQYSAPIGVQTPYQGIPGLLPNGLSNPYLQWEETKKIQSGLDLGFLKDRILLNINYFHNRSSNQLTPYILPISTGFSSIIRNFPATIQNSGWEFTLNTINLKTRDFNWSSNFNLTLPKNKLVAFPNLAASDYANILVIGQPITLIKAYHSLGVDPATGVYQFADSHGTPTSSPVYPTDQTVLLNTSPKFYGGFENNFKYKGFELDFLFQFVKQIGPNYFLGSTPGVFLSGDFLNGNQPVSVLNRWQKPGDIASHQRYNSDYSIIGPYFTAAYSSDAGWSDASFIRLKNVYLSWQLPDTWRRKVHLQNCRLYMQGQNLFTITNYQGLDPENKSVYSLPPLRQLTVGLQLTL